MGPLVGIVGQDELCATVAAADQRGRGEDVGQLQGVGRCWRRSGRAHLTRPVRQRPGGPLALVLLWERIADCLDHVQPRQRARVVVAGRRLVGPRERVDDRDLVLVSPGWPAAAWGTAVVLSMLTSEGC